MICADLRSPSLTEKGAGGKKKQKKTFTDMQKIPWYRPRLRIYSSHGC